MKQEEIRKIADKVTANIISCTKEFLTASETAIYLGISKSYLYKLTSHRMIPFYRPQGKLMLFKRQELNGWVQSNRVEPDSELSQLAMEYCRKGGAR